MVDRYLTDMYNSPDPSELPIPVFSGIKDDLGNLSKNLVLIISDDIMSKIMLGILKPNWHNFEITYNINWIPDLEIKGFPTVYCRKTNTIHLGVTCYKSLMSFFKLL